MQRGRGEGGDVRDGVLDEGFGGPLADPLGALLHTIAHLRLLEAHPEGQGAEENIALRQGVEGIHNLAVKQLKVRGRAHVHAGGAANEAVEAVGGELVKSALLAAILLDALDHLVALFPEAVHLNDLLGRVLQVAVHDDHAVALCLLKTGEHGGLLAEVAAEVDAYHMFVRLCAAPDLVPGSVARAVVHEQQLVVDLRIAQDLPQALGGDGDHFFFIV